MRLLSSSVVALLFILAFATAREARAEVKMTNCPSFAATMWVDPMSKKSGNQYALSMANADMTCAQATVVAKKLIAEHSSGAANQPFDLSGAPAGYSCHGTADANGHAYRGGCRRPSPDFSGPAISWRPAPSS
jgi:hypothetical protein